MITSSAMLSIMAQLDDDMSGGTVTLHLFTNDIVLTPLLTTADFTAPTYDGYGAATVTIAGAPWDDDLGNGVLSLSGAHFQPTGATVADTIHGWYLLGPASAGGTNKILAMEKLDPPVVLASAADALDLITHVKVGQPLE